MARARMGARHFDHRSACCERTLFCRVQHHSDCRGRLEGWCWSVCVLSSGGIRSVAPVGMGATQLLFAKACHRADSLIDWLID